MAEPHHRRVQVPPELEVNWGIPKLPVGLGGKAHRVTPKPKGTGRWQSEEHKLSDWLKLDPGPGRVFPSEKTPHSRDEQQKPPQDGSYMMQRCICCDVVFQLSLRKNVAPWS